MLSKITVARGEIQRLSTEAVLNAANTSLSHGAGICGDIFEAAGAVELAKACSYIGGCKVGDAVAAPGFHLPAKWIIHAVGPRCKDGKQHEAELLRSTYKAILRVADELRVESIAIPAISTGIFCFPKDLAAEIAIDTLVNSNSQVQSIVLVGFTQEDADRYTAFLHSN